MKKRLMAVFLFFVVIVLLTQVSYSQACFEVSSDNSIYFPNFMNRVPEMEKIFDNQIAELRSRGFGNQFLNELMIMRITVTVKAAKMNIPKGNIPFIPAINVAYALTGKCGDPTRKDDYKKINIINKKQFFGLGEISEADDRTCPYYIYNVSPGHDMLGISPKEAKIKMASEERRPLNIIEGAFLYFLTDGVAKNGMWFGGSRCNGKIPVIYVKNGEIYLDCENSDNKYADRGVTSCATE